MTHSLKLERRCTYCYLRVSLDVWQKQCDYTLELKGSQNVSKSCPDSRNSSSYLHDPFLNSPKNHQFFWATFVSNFVRVNFQKLPDLVTLDRRLNRQKSGQSYEGSGYDRTDQIIAYTQLYSRIVKYAIKTCLFFLLKLLKQV